MMDTPHVDIAGVGIGPFNLGLAALLSRHPGVTSIFLDRKAEFRWHEGLLLPGTTLQVPFLADLVTMADPTHPLSYLNYLHQHDRLYPFYYYENFQVPRREYDHYCRWASQQLPDCHFGEDICEVSYDASVDRFLIESQSVSGFKRHYYSRDLAIGIGTVPLLPKWAQVKSTAPVMHSAEFGKRQAQLAQCQRVTVIGSGQSAAECVLALFNELTPERIAAGASIRWVTRSPGFHPMEYATLHHFTYRPTMYGMAEQDDAAFFEWRSRQRVVIGHDTWIGHGAVIMPGVRIGNGAVVGSNSVVTKDVPAYAIVGGVAAKVIRRRFPQAISDALEATAWWDWDHDTLTERMPEFKDLRSFLAK